MSLIKNLFYKIDDFTLDIPQWILPDTGISALTGDSGSGKSTILKILCGLTACPQLQWDFKGINLAKLSPAQRGIGMCFQDLRLFPHLTVKQNILFAVQASKNKTLLKEQDFFDDIIKALKLTRCLNLFTENLSGGEKQRLALARALILKPRFLFLDEAFNSLDKHNKEQARHLTIHIATKYSIPVLLVSHDQEDIKQLAQTEFFLNKGKLYTKKTSLNL